MVVLLAWVVFRPLEPRYHGRTLTRWLEQYDYNPGNETNLLEEAQRAVRAIGAKKALPVLINLVAAKNDPVSSWLIDRTSEFRNRYFRSRAHYNDSSFEDYERIQWHSADDFQQLGIAGFEILGTNAAPAVRELGRLLNDKDHAAAAERCLQYIGKPAEPVVCAALTNQDTAIRQWAMNQLGYVTDDVVVYLARIKRRLQDSAVEARRTAVDDIGIQTSAPELAVPLLVEALKDDSVRVNAVNALANFGTNAWVALPLITNWVESNDHDLACAALKTLVTIAPERFLPSYAHGRPGTGEALKVLTDKAPDQALPIVLNLLKSPDGETRRVAFRLLCQYPMTLEVEAAMQTAAADSDSDIAQRAKEILTDQYQKHHPQEGQFLDDPSYGGKRLGEWMKMRDSDGQFLPGVTNAIQQIGTNAIPALLQRLAYAKPPFGLPAWQINIDGATGFIALGGQAVPALPQLAALLDKTNQSLVSYAMAGSLGTGTNAIPLLTKALTNRFAEVRSEAGHNLTEVIALRFPETRREIIPLLLKLLNDPDPEARQNVRGDLQELNYTNIPNPK